MTTKRVTALKPGTIVHVETPNGVINIRVGLRDADGHDVDAIEIIPSNYAGEKKVIRRGDRLIRTNVKYRP